MYKHILIPTDGSELSHKAIREGIDLAKSINAQVTLLTKNQCDLILMASHGRKGLKGIVLGSETHKVLTHTKIPVLVCR